MIYLDYNSSAPVHPEVTDAMTEALRSLYGNPSSAHSAGAAAAVAVENARVQVASLVGAEPADVTFCSSATEAINTVIRAARGTVVTTVVEHSATLRAVDEIEKEGAKAIRLRVDGDGLVSLVELAAVLDSQPVALVSIIWVNNETGAISQIEAIANLCENHGVALHVDAVQAAGRIPISLDILPIDFLTISAHKLGGPKGVAALINRQGHPITPLIVGGGQEHGRRSGTENVPGIVGFGVAAKLALQRLDSIRVNLASLRDRLEASIKASVPTAGINSIGAIRISNTSSMYFPGVNGDDLATYLDGQGICVSTGSACQAATSNPSHVIQAMTNSRWRAECTVRFSLGPHNSVEDIDQCAKAVATGVALLSAMSVPER